MQRISLKLPDDLLAQLNSEGEGQAHDEIGISPRHYWRGSNILAGVECPFGPGKPEAALQKPVRSQGLSCYDLARDLAGAVKGLPEDLAENSAYLKSSF